ncbi:MAG: tetratricopeptide repeat protein, partial [Acidobacteriota bacterium]
AYIRYRRLMQSYPENVSGYIGLGNVLLHQSLFDEAEEVFARCLDKFPGNMHVQERYAHVALSNVDFESARSRYELLVALHPDSVEGYVGLGDVLLRQNLFAAAEKVFEYCLKRFPDNTNVYMRYAFTALRKQCLDEAYSRYERLNEVHPEQVAGYIAQINILFRKKSCSEARVLIDRFVTLFGYNRQFIASMLKCHAMFVARNGHIECPFFTMLVLRLYSHLMKYALPLERCVDYYLYIYANLLGARAMYLQESQGNSQIFNRKLNSRYRLIALFGDSHVLPTFYCPRQFESLGFKAQFFSVAGASISGLGKNNSTLELLPKITRYIANKNPDYVLLKFGQVDIEFGYYYKKFIKKERIPDMGVFMESLLEVYKKNIETLKDMTNLVVGCINLPSIFSRRHCASRTMGVITDVMPEGQCAAIYGKLLALQPSILSRTKYALCFNAKLGEICREAGVCFVDSTSIFQDTTTGLLHSYNQSDFDQHYVTSDFVRSKVVKLTIDRITEAPGTTPPAAAWG